MNKIKFLILSCSLATLLACTNNDEQLNSEKVISLKFKRHLLIANKYSDTLINIDVKILSFAPLAIESNYVKQVKVFDESNVETEGFVLVEDYSNIINLNSRLIETPGYIFNNRTQCFMYGTYITDSETGKWTFLFAVPAVQFQMNVCAPSGQLYAK